MRFQANYLLVDRGAIRIDRTLGPNSVFINRYVIIRKHRLELFLKSGAVSVYILCGKALDLCDDLLDVLYLGTQIGFDPGTLSFDQSNGIKTATEVISENSKTFGTVKAHENSIKDSLEQMVRAIIELSVHYGLTYEGQSIESLIGNGYNVSIKFDDSIIEDKNAEISRGTMLVGAGLMSRYKFMTDTLGYTPEEAEAELKRVSDESNRINAVEVTRLFGNVE